jgi:hypothetical protein
MQHFSFHAAAYAIKPITVTGIFVVVFTNTNWQFAPPV